MHRRQRYKEQSLHNAQAFLDTQPVLDALKGSDGRKQLDASVERLAEHAGTQATSDDVLVNATAVEAGAIKALKRNHMCPIARFARVRLPDAPALAALAQSIWATQGARIVIDARAMTTALISHAAVFAAAGFPCDVAEQLAAATDAVEAATRARTAARNARVIATAGIKEEVRRGRQAVALLDSIVTKLLGLQQELVIGWRQSKHVIAKPGGVGPARQASPSPPRALRLPRRRVRARVRWAGRRAPRRRHEGHGRRSRTH